MIDPYAYLSLDLLVFAIVALVIVLCSLLVVFARSIVHSALSLIGALFGVAVLYVLLYAPFVGLVQALIYIGGVGTLILFAVMLTRRGESGA